MRFQMNVCQVEALPREEAIRKYPSRRTLRLPVHDYAQSGAYFITVCTYLRRCIFGHIDNGRMILNAWGRIVQEEWYRIPEIHAGVALDAFVVMPSHVHGILVLRHGFVTVQPKNRRRPGGPGSTELGRIIGQWKARVSRRIRKRVGDRRLKVWQRNYYEHIIRHQKAYDRIRAYIHTNPRRWRLDRENPHRSADDPFDTWLATYTRDL